MTWYNASWTYRVAVTVNHSVLAANETNFPVFLDLSLLPAHFFTNANTGGGDIRITESDGATEVAREVVYCDNTNQKGEVHFNAPSLSSTADTVFYVYYGNSAASDYLATDTYGSEAVWDANFLAVYHFGDGTTLSLSDSTSNANTLTNSGATAGTGLVGGGAVLNGSSYMDTPLNPSGSMTIETLVNFSSVATGNPRVAANSHLDSTTPKSGLELGTSSGGSPSYFYGGDGTTAYASNYSGASISTGNWYGLGGNFGASTTQYIYFNGAAQAGAATGASGMAAGPANIALGYNPIYTGDYVTGTMDEVRISNINRASTWIADSYANQSSAGTFTLVGIPTDSSGTSYYSTPSIVQTAWANEFYNAFSLASTPIPGHLLIGVAWTPTTPVLDATGFWTNILNVNDGYGNLVVSYHYVVGGDTTTPTELMTSGGTPYIFVVHEIKDANSSWANALDGTTHGSGSATPLATNNLTTASNYELGLLYAFTNGHDNGQVFGATNFTADVDYTQTTATNDRAVYAGHLAEPTSGATVNSSLSVNKTPYTMSYAMITLGADTSAGGGGGSSTVVTVPNSIILC